MNWQEINPSIAEAYAIVNDQVEAQIPGVARIQLPSSALIKLRYAESHIINYFSEKYARYGLDFEANRIPKVVYETVNDAGVFEAAKNAFGGRYQIPQSRDASPLIHVLTAHDTLMTSMLAAHEASHAFTFHGVFQHPLSSKENDYLLVVGLDQQYIMNGEMKREYAALENGMAFMDTMDMKSEFLEAVFADDSQRAANVANETSVRIQAELADEEKILFGNPNPLVERLLTNARAYGVPFQQDTQYDIRFATGQYKQFRFTEEICRLLGYVLIQRYGIGSMDSETYAQTGREFVEKDRFSGSTTAITVLESLFTKEELTVVKSVDDVNTNIIEGMQVVKSKQAELD